MNISENIQQVPLSKLRVCSEVQSRVSPNQDTIEEYVEALRPKGDQPGDTFPPLDVVQEGDGYIVADGFHRVAAYVAMHGEDSDVLIDVQVHPLRVGYTPLESAQYLSCTSNLTHGLRRSKADKLEMIKMFLTLPDNAEKSNSIIASELKVSRRNVAEGRQFVEPSGCAIAQPDGSDQPVTVDTDSPVIESVQKRRGRDGKRYSVKSKVPRTLKESGKAPFEDFSELLQQTGEAGKADKAIQTYTECGKLCDKGQYDGRKLRKGIAQLQKAVDDISHIEVVLSELVESGIAVMNLDVIIEVLGQHVDIPVDSLKMNRSAKEKLFIERRQTLANMRNFIGTFPQIVDPLFTGCSTEDEQTLVNNVRAKFDEQKQTVEAAIVTKQAMTMKVLGMGDAKPLAEWFTPQPAKQ